MHNTYLFFITIGLFSLINPNQAQAISCGDFITSNTVLTEDLECTSGFTALFIGADDVTLDLNGFSLSGPRDMEGVVVLNHNNVKIIGNGGVIKGFWVGINTSESNSLQVESTNFYDLGAGVIISSGNNAIIKNNDFIQINSSAVSIVNYLAGLTANNNLVVNNEFFKTGWGVDVCGDASDRNKIRNNLIWLSKYNGIRINRSDRNRIYNNRILEATDSAIWLINASRNRISGNSLRIGRVGLVVTADEDRDDCLNISRNISRNNIFTGNHAFEFETALVLGDSESSSANVFNNDLTGNKLYDNTLGIFFNTSAHNNDATANAYTGTTTDVSDLGVDNDY